MSADSAKLTQEHRKRFEEHINRKATLIGKCPVCSSRAWTVLEHFVQIPLYHTDGNTYLGGGASYPNVGLVCTNCGNTQLINAVFSGVLTDGTQTASPTPEEAKSGTERS